MKYIAIIATLVIVISAGSAAQSKCPMKPYTFRGSVLNSRTSVPEANAKIYIFLDSQRSTWAKGYATKYPDFYVTNVDGVFYGDIFFDTYSSTSVWGGDRCEKVPETLEILVLKDGYKANRSIYNFREMKLEQTGNTTIIGIPPIEVEQ